MDSLLTRVKLIPENTGVILCQWCKGTFLWNAEALDTVISNKIEWKWRFCPCMKLCIHSHSYASMHAWVKLSRGVRMALASAQCGTMLPTLSYSLNVDFQRCVWSSIAPDRPTPSNYPAGPLPSAQLWIHSPAAMAAPVPPAYCQGAVGRGKASRWTRWEEGDVSSYRVLTTFFCAVC